MALTSKPIA